MCLCVWQCQQCQSGTLLSYLPAVICLDWSQLSLTQLTCHSFLITCHHNHATSSHFWRHGLTSQQSKTWGFLLSLFNVTCEAWWQSMMLTHTHTHCCVFIQEDKITIVQEAGVPGGNQCRRRENMRAPHRKGPIHDVARILRSDGCFKLSVTFLGRFLCVSKHCPCWGNQCCYWVLLLTFCTCEREMIYFNWYHAMIAENLLFWVIYVWCQSLFWRSGQKCQSCFQQLKIIANHILIFRKLFLLLSIPN